MQRCGNFVPVVEDTLGKGRTHLPPFCNGANRYWMCSQTARVHLIRLQPYRAAVSTLVGIRT
jgi:hypothetical protein